MKDGKFEIGDKVRFTPPDSEMEDVKKYYPLDCACVGCSGLVELTGAGPKVRMPKGHVIEGWPPDFFTLVEETSVQDRHIAGLSPEAIDPEAYRDFMQGLS